MKNPIKSIAACEHLSRSGVLDCIELRRCRSCIRLYRRLQSGKYRLAPRLCPSCIGFCRSHHFLRVPDHFRATGHMTGPLGAAAHISHQTTIKLSPIPPDPVRPPPDASRGLARTVERDDDEAPKGVRAKLGLALGGEQAARLGQLALRRDAHDDLGDVRSPLGGAQLGDVG